MDVCIKTEPLTPAAFARFGDVIRHEADDRRHFFPAVHDADASMTQPMAWVSRMPSAVRLPLEITQLERHPHSAQTFVPLSQTPYVVVVAGSFEDGTPDPDSLRAFLAEPLQGVCFHRGTWHFGLSPLTDQAQFFVVMGKATSSAAADDEFVPLGKTCYVELA